MFAGERDEIRYVAAMPPRVQEGGAYFFRLAVMRNGDKSQLVLERTIPDPAATENPEFTDAEHSVLAEGIAELRVSYFGRDANAADVDVAELARSLGRPAATAAAHANRREAGQRACRGPRWWSSPGARPNPRARRTTRRAIAAWGRADERYPPRNSLPPPERQDGIALIAVLWLTILLTVIASGFAFSMHGEAVAARNALSLAQARAAADGAIERTAFELTRPRNLPDVWHADGSAQTWLDGEVKLTTVAVDESARIDLNTAADPLLKGLLQNVGGLDAFAADACWRRSPTGATSTT